MKRRAVGLLIAALVFPAYGASALPAFAATAEPATKDTLTVALTADPQSLDPMIDSSGATQNILHNVFDSLVVADDNLQQVGDLAESWEFVAPSSWDFKLRPGVKFQNGDPVTADDVAYSYSRILDPANNSAMASFITPITSVTAVDPTTVRITTSTPSPIVPEITKDVMIVPKNVVESQGAQAFGQLPIGSGPYQVTEWVPNDHITMVANPDYWAGEAPIKNVIMKPITDPATRVAALETNQVDLISNFDVSFYDELNSHPEIKVANVPQGRTAEIILDTNPADNFAPFQDVRVRQAVNEAINYDAIISQVMGGLAIRNCQPVTEIIFGYDPNVTCPTYNPEHAKQLLTEAGYPNGFEVTFGGATGQSPGDAETQQAIVGDLAKVGITVHLQNEDFGTWLDDYHKRKWPMVFHTNGTNVLDADPDIFQLFYASTGRGYYSSPEMDAMIAAEENTFDATQRLPLVQAVIKKAMDNYLWVSLYNEPDLWAMNSQLNFAPRGDEWTVMNRASWQP